MKYATISNIVKGEYGRSNGRFLDVFSPLNGEVISQVPLSSADVVDEAVAAAKQAFPGGGGSDKRFEPSP
jgi:acyl-CoA reductase-like NAD-dependent aldehyde dehydrogenase